MKNMCCSTFSTSELEKPIKRIIQHYFRNVRNVYLDCLNIGIAIEAEPCEEGEIERYIVMVIVL